ncbi:Pol protein [Phytophthora palmivora]|uniref:Pol protein n=1 Tax=Phytophthora palmivora TaxID=4796 RepID=A0A2P4XIL9_9STRA|nr:Pol protein [Phytophthora palmivora]
MPWHRKHEPWIDYRGKAIGAGRPAASDRALVSSVHTSVRDWGVRDGRQCDDAPEEVLGVIDANEGVAMCLATSHETKAHCQACGIGAMAGSNANGRRVCRTALTRAANIGPQAAEAAEEIIEDVSCPRSSANTAAVEEDAESASGVGNIVPRKVDATEKKNESAACVSSSSTRGLEDLYADGGAVEYLSCVPHSESETPPARPIEDQYHIFNDVSRRLVKADAVLLETLPEMSALLNLEELSRKDFLVELKAGYGAPEAGDLSQRFELFLRHRRGYPGGVHEACNALGFSVVVLKHPPSQLPQDRRVRHAIDLVPGTKYCVTRQWHLPREQCESGMTWELKSPRLVPTFCVRKPNRRWRLVHVFNKLNNATVPAQTPIPRKDVLLNYMSDCTMYSAFGLVDGYNQILMRQSDIPLTTVSTQAGSSAGG